MTNEFDSRPNKPKSPAAIKSYDILDSARLTVHSFHALFVKLRADRQAIGTSTDEEQDLLRAMLLFASAGLDSMVKQLIDDALGDVIDKDEGANEMFRAHIERKIQRDEKIGTKIIARALTNRSPRDEMKADLIGELGSGSLQSKEELLRAAAHFNIPSGSVCKDIKLIEEVFRARNEITHEMDIDFSQSNRSRRPRKKDTMIKYASEILRVAGTFLDEVDKKLSATQ